MKILLVEDDPADASMLKETFREGRFVKYDVTHVDNITKAIECLQKLSFDVILLDLYLPDSRGIDTFRTLHAKSPTLPIVLLTGRDDEVLAVQLVQEGAQDYLVKGQINNKSLLRSVRYAVERNQDISEQAKRKDEIVKSKLAEYNITNREKEILILMSLGKTNEEIASSLHLSLSTIRNHMSKIFVKLHVSNRAQAAAFVVQVGLLKQDVM